MDDIKRRIEDLERQVGIPVKPWATVYKAPAKKKKKKTVPQAEPAEVESHPTHNWNEGSPG